ncbi:phosphatase PAP2 family protein [Acidobacteriota bacterium]
MENEKNSNIIKVPSYWIWGLPLLLCIPIIIILINDTNIDVFFSINSISKFTGDRIWALLSLFANGLIVFVVLTPWIRKNPRLICAVMIAGIIYLLVGHSMKILLDVPRPPQVIDPAHFHLIGPAWMKNSFPSGHATMAFILTGVFALTVSRVWLRILLIIAGSLMAMSRIVIGVHWPLDVLAGAILGWLSIWLALKLSAKTRWVWSGLGQRIMGGLLILCCVYALSLYSSSIQMVMFEQRIIAEVFLLIGIYEYLKLFGFDPLRRRKKG